MDFVQLKELLTIEHPSVVLEYNRDIVKIMPEFSKTIGFDQKTLWQPDDIYTHTLKVLDNTCTDIRVRIAALFHDVGKPECFCIDKYGCGHFYGHWLESDYIFMKYKDYFDLSNEDVILIRKLIYFHHKKINEYSIKHFLDYFDQEDIGLLYSLKRANIFGQNKKFQKESLRNLDSEFDYFTKMLEEKKETSITVKAVGDSKHYTYLDLYQERILLLALWLNDNPDVIAYKTKCALTDSVDVMFDDNFIIMINTQDGLIRYNISLTYWDLFTIPEIPYIHFSGKSKPSENIMKLNLEVNKQYIKK